jgi:RNA polymerase sigma-70 factor, ECF subfamily
MLRSGHCRSSMRRIALMHLDGLSYREMGEVLGISENHVGVRLHRIRKQLTEQLKEPTDEL